MAACGNDFHGEVVGLKLEINEFLMQEERMWHQREKSHWITLGDKNTRFFHSRASQRYRRNKICGLRNSMGEMCTGIDNVAALLVNYYQ